MIFIRTIKRILFAISTLATISILFSCQKEPEVVKVESVTLNSTSITMVEGELKSLTATVSPSTATNKIVIWSSSNSSVAGVDDRGTVTAIAPGTATITAKSDDGGKTATCSVTVNSKVISVESVSLDKTTAEITEGETITLTATVKPDNATNKKVIWSSSNEEIATVKDGVVTAIKAGEATITAKTEDGGKTASCSVVVKEKVYPVESIELDKTTAEITEGETVTLTATIKPENATNKNVIWSSSNEEIATVEDGVVTAIKAGEATITAKTEDGEKTATCDVKVNAKVYPVESVSLDKTSASLKEGETITLTATVMPDNATDKTVTWSSSDASVASVEDGVVTAKKIGTATITAKAGDKTANCAITIESFFSDDSSFVFDGIYYQIIENTNEVKVILGPQKYKGNIKLPDTVTYKDKEYLVTHLDYAVFYGCTELIEFNSGKSLVEIPISSFGNCTSLSKLVIGKNINLIAKDSFNGCSALKTIIIEDSANILKFESTINGSYKSPRQFKDSPVETLYIGRNLSYSLGWYDSSSPFPKTLKGVTFGSMATIIPTGCCQGCSNLKQVLIPQNIIKISECAFEGTSIEHFIIPNTINKIGGHALASNCPYSVTIEDGNNVLEFNTTDFYVQSDPFRKEKIRDIYIGRNIKYVDYVSSSSYSCLFSPLANSNLSKVIFGPKMTEIGSYLFYGCNNLENITIHSNITSIKNNSFENCLNLKEIYVEAETPISDVDASSFSTDTYVNSKLCVPSKSISLYQKAPVWQYFRNISGR